MRLVDGILVPKAFELVPLSKVRASADNPRLHSVDQVDAIAAMVREVGFLVPVLLDRGGTIIAGAGRREVCIRLGMKSLPSVRAAHLSEAQVRALMVADNKLASMSTWSAPLLGKALAGIAEDFGSVEIAGFSDEELRRISDDLARVSLAPTSRSGGDEEDDGGPGQGIDRAHDDDDEDSDVPFQVLITAAEREEVYAALRKVKARDKVSQSGAALLTIIREWKP